MKVNKKKKKKEEKKFRGNGTNIDGIAVYCSNTAIIPIGQMKPHPKNPNKHPQNQITLLAKIIKVQGWRAPITVSDLSGFIIKGHARLEAAKMLGLSAVPVDAQHYDNEEAEYSDMLADNRIAELSELDMSGVKDILQELDTGKLDMDLTGYDSVSIETLMNQYHPTIDRSHVSNEDVSDARSGINNSVGSTEDKRSILCPKCGHNFLIDKESA